MVLDLNPPPILTLPCEILFDIFLCLDFRGLLSVAQTCRTLHDITNDRHFWDTLRSILESRPGIQPPFFEEDDKRSLDGLRQYTLTILRAHNTWLAPSLPRFRHYIVESPYGWYKTEVLPGGRWLFGLDRHGAAMVDLDSGVQYRLFRAPDPRDIAPLDGFQISFKEGVRSSFWVALYNGVKWVATINLICIYEVDYCPDRHPPFQATRLTTIWETDSGPRNSVEVSDRYIVQCYRQRNGDCDEILQIRRFSTDPKVSENYVECLLQRDSTRYNPQCVTRLLPHDRLAVVVISAIKIYAIDDSSDKTLPHFYLLHRLELEIHACAISRTFVGQSGTYLVGSCGRTARRVHISHDPAVPPTIEIMGRLRSRCERNKSSSEFRSLVSFSHEGPELEMGTYDLTSDSSGYRWLFLDDLSRFKDDVPINRIVGLDDNVGRLVLWCTDNPYWYDGGPGPSSYFLIMDII